MPMRIISPCGKCWNRQRHLVSKPERWKLIEEFVTMIKSFQSMLKKQNAYEVAFHVGKQTNIVKELFNDKSTEGVAPL